MKIRSLWLTALCALMVAGGFTSCLDDDDNGNNQKPIEPVVVADGVFIVNEGNFANKINGSLDFLSYDTSDDKYPNGRIVSDVFKTQTERNLGGTPNSAELCHNALFIACTDENVVEVLDLTSNYATQIKVNAPRELATDGSYVYVSSYDGTVTKINGSSYAVMKTSEKIGSKLEGITVLNGHVYVCNAYETTFNATTGYDDYNYQTNVVKLNAETLAKEKDITVAANPNIILTDGENVYVDSWGNYYDVQPSVQKIDTNDNVTALTAANWMAYYNEKLYLIEQSYDENWNSTFKYKVYSLASGTESTFITDTDKSIFYPGTIGVDPLLGDVYITSYVPGEYGYADYSANGYVMRYKNNGTFVEKYETGVGPCTLVFLGHVVYQ